MNSIKLKYLVRSVLNYKQARVCPFCGSSRNEVIDAKYYFTKLLRCSGCSLQFRFPKDDPAYLDKFYQKEYDIDTLLITATPSDEELEQMKESDFPMVRNYVSFISALTMEKNARIVDYGCSWGYSLYPLQKHGYSVSGFEISRPRAKFGREKLGLQIVSDFSELPGGNDFVICSHVIEHLADINELIKNVKSILATNGLFLLFCPNGSKEYRQREPGIFHVNWGFLHPNYIDIPFIEKAFKDYSYCILTDDWKFDMDILKGWDRTSQYVGEKRDGKELFVAVAMK